MRVILKPGGLAILLMAIVGIAAVAVLNGRSPKTKRVSATPATSPVAPIRRELAQDPGFEEDFAAVVPYSDIGKVTGKTAKAWHDDSSWARVEVAYSRDTTRFHGGRASQKIELKKVVREKKGADAMQFVQRVELTVGKTYESAIWVCAEKPVEVEYALRQATGEYTFNGSKKITATAEWQRISLECPIISKDGGTYLFVWLKTPGTIWVDDATCTEK